MVEHVRGDEGLHHAPVGECGDRSHGDGGLVVAEGRAVHRTERLGQSPGVAASRRSGLELAARVESEAAGRGVAAGAGVVVEAVLVGTAVVVDDRRAEMEAVVQRRSADAANHAVNRFDAAAAPVRQAGALAVLAQFVHQRLVNLLRLIGGRARIRVLNARARRLDHVPHARARPRPHAEKDIVHIAQRVEPQYGRVNPTVHRNVGRTQRTGRADGGHAAALARLSGALGRDGTGRQKEKSSQQRRALHNSSRATTFAQIHTPHSITRLPRLNAGNGSRRRANPQAVLGGHLNGLLTSSIDWLLRGRPSAPS